jgi:putative ABC transport system permease protein
MRLDDWLYRIPLRLRSLMHRETVEEELDEELRDHIERQTEENLACGMSPSEARRAALIALGGLEQRKQQCRETRGVHWIHDLGQDLLYGLRKMRRDPGFSIAALLIVALGIGANTAIFSADHALLFRVLPYKDPGRLVDVFQKSLADAGTDRMPVAPANYFDWSADHQQFESFAAWQTTNFNLSGGDNPERVRAASVSANLFDVLGVEPMLGRTFVAGEDAPGKGSLVILSYGLWQRRFSGDRNVVGKTMRANDQTYTVVGVMPEGFRFPIGWVSSDVEVWTPLVLSDAQRISRKDIVLMVIARLRSGVSLAQAQAGLGAVSQRLAQAWPETNKDWGVNVTPLADAGISDYRSLFVLLSVAVGLVLLIACANVANLLLARGMERQKELTVRAALGARRGRLVRQLMTEGVLLSFLGGLAGIGLGLLGTRALALLAPATDLPDLQHLTLRAPVLLLSLGLSIATGVLFSVLPAITLSRTRLQGTLQETGRANTGTVRGHRLKAALVTGEVALTLALLLCAGDILNSFFSYMRIDPGFDVQNVLTMRLSLPKQKYANPQQWATFFNRAVEQVRTIPGVTAAAAGSGAPMEGQGSVLRFHIAGGEVPQTSDEHTMVEYLRITPDYFRATGIRLLRGRSVLASDLQSPQRANRGHAGDPDSGRPGVAVVNETFARKEFGDSDPIGKRIFLDGDVNESAAASTTGPPLEIVGVVRDTKEYGLFQITPQMIYVSMAQDPEPAMSLVVKSTADPGSLAAEIRRRVTKLDPDQPVYNVRSLQEIFHNEHAFFRFNTLLLAVFAGMALVLSLIGIYAVMAYAVSQRAREFGIRLALGSPRGRILGLVLRQGVWMGLIGIACGLALSWPATKLLARALNESMFLKLVHTGPVLFPVLSAGMVLTMLLACVLPARRATQADPLETLRSE